MFRTENKENGRKLIAQKCKQAICLEPIAHARKDRSERRNRGHPEQKERESQEKKDSIGTHTVQ